MITKCYTISQLLAWTNIMMADCEDRVNVMNNILSDFYDFMYGSPLIKVGEGFVGSWEKTMQLSYEPYKIEWFYGYGTACQNNKCFIKVPSCLDCSCPELYQIKMEQSIYWLSGSQYKVTYVEADDRWILDFNIPNWVDQWWVVYSITQKPLINYSDTICIDPRLLQWVRYMIKKYIAENDREMNLAQYYSGELEKRKQRKDKDLVQNLISVVTTNVR